ncbi:hypothetical protein SAMN05421837_1031000 [Amycolatopsis pretoriensis]|uniref:Uncharacterized protein n=1 Tax=Amycolatopsis pretoriensis TaxID=218821 RepID=A0A1H5QNI9_9PSEU|nr:hypothetical protein [Amycolatopsis pretoriensis]SEF27703.1 hypothetical protein SAMN05421837_1031000 [Amycolatopsis pretoriensis]
MSSNQIKPESGKAVPFVRPTTITIAFWAFLASTILGLTNGVVALFTGNSSGDAVRTVVVENGTDLSQQQVDQVSTVTNAGALVFSVIMSLLYILFAAKLRSGRNWARVLLTVVAGLQLLAITFGQSTILGYFSAMSAVVGAVSSFVNPSNDYFRAVKAAR